MVLINPTRKLAPAIHPRFVQKSNDENKDFATWMSDATKPNLTPCEKIKNSKRIKFLQFSSKACNDINVQGKKRKHY